MSGLSPEAWTLSASRPATVSPIRLIPWCCSTCWRRVDEYVTDVGEYALVIADEVDAQAKHRADLSTYREVGTLGYRHRKLTRIMDTLHFAPSNASRLVQAADVIAFLYRRVFACQESDERSRKAKLAMWNRLLPRVQHQRCWFPCKGSGQMSLWGRPRERVGQPARLKTALIAPHLGPPGAWSAIRPGAPALRASDHEVRRKRSLTHRRQGRRCKASAGSWKHVLSALGDQPHLEIAPRPGEISRDGADNGCCPICDNFLYYFQGRAERAGPGWPPLLGQRRALYALTGRRVVSANQRSVLSGERCAPGRRLPLLGPPGHGGVGARVLPAARRTG